jgi:hypothetical protein
MIQVNSLHLEASRIFNLALSSYMQLGALVLR